jgi:hypothetical protein
VGAIAAMAAKFTIVVERSAPKEAPPAPAETATAV